LRYNLLTAYTSFIAVDTMVRNEDGSITSVKQPLPLPQGVSDYAVGGVAAHYKAISGTQQSMRRSLPASSADTLAEESVVQKKENSINLKIDKILVERGLSKGDVLNVVQQHISDIRKCYAKGVYSGFTVQFDITSKGFVKGVQVTSGEPIDRRTEACIVRQIKKWQFPVTKGKGVKTTVTITFTT